MIPTQERFESFNRGVFERNDRLVRHAEFVMLEPDQHIRCEPHPFRGRLLHRSAEEHVAPAAHALRVVHRRIGIAQELVGRDVRLRDADADARVNDDGLPFDYDRHAQCVLRTFCNRGDFRFPARRHEEREFVAMKAGEHVARPNHIEETPCDRHEHVVACGVPERVVYELEAIEVDQHHGLATRALRAMRGENHGDVFEERSARTQAGQRIVLRFVAELFGERLPLGNVCDHRDRGDGIAVGDADRKDRHVEPAHRAVARDDLSLELWRA